VEHGRGLTALIPLKYFWSVLVVAAAEVEPALEAVTPGEAVEAQDRQ
jgi:hypothetical protein